MKKFKKEIFSIIAFTIIIICGVVFLQNEIVRTADNLKVSQPHNVNVSFDPSGQYKIQHSESKSADITFKEDKSYFTIQAKGFKAQQPLNASVNNEKYLTFIPADWAGRIEFKMGKAADANTACFYFMTAAQENSLCHNFDQGKG